MSRKITSVLGFDYGKKRIGLATGQTITYSATPCKTIKQIDGNPDWAAIEAEIQQWKPQALIVGMPLSYRRQRKQNDCGCQTILLRTGKAI